MNAPLPLLPAVSKIKVHASPLWIVQNNGVGRVTSAIAQALRKNKRAILDISVHGVETFEADLDARLKEEGIDNVFQNPVFFMGSALMLKAVQASKKYQYMAAGYTPENYESPVWADALGKLMLNSSVAIGTLADVRAQKAPVFVRPFESHKLFTGAVICPDIFDAWLDSARQRNPEITMESVVCLSRVKEIQSEWRIVVLDGQPKLWSKYAEGGMPTVSPDTPASALEFARKVASIWLPDDCCTMDIAKTSDGYRVVEFNSIHCCGLYSIPAKSFIDEVDCFLG